MIDTSTLTHLARSGHDEIIGLLAPGGVVLVPSDVNAEIEEGRERYSCMPWVPSIPWARIAVLSDDELMTQAQVKAEMGGGPREHLGECAVIACALHRNMVAVMDDRAAIAQADRLGVATRDTLWLVIEAFRHIFAGDRIVAAGLVDDLLDTGMYLPIKSGESLFAWAYVEGLLP